MSARDMTDEDVYIRYAQRSYITVAEKLEAVAARMRELAERVPSNRTSAVGQAADAISEYTQGVGAIGTHLWAVVRSADDLDLYRRKQADRDGGAR